MEVASPEAIGDRAAAGPWAGELGPYNAAAAEML